MSAEKVNLAAKAEASYRVRPLLTTSELQATVSLYREVFDLSATDPAVGPRLLSALQRNGGTVIGALVGDRVVGFVYGFVGLEPGTGELYHYSQTAAVSAEMRGRGVGRALKLGQREQVLKTGITKMRWSYDPVRASNAYFNLDVLGARARWFVPNLYGVDESGRDAGSPSDRLIVEWDLRDEPTGVGPDGAGTASAVADLPDATEAGWGVGVEQGEHSLGRRLLVPVPRHWEQVAADVDRATAIRAATRATFESAMADGWVAYSCRPVDDTTAVYRLYRPGPETPRPDPPRRPGTNETGGDA